MANATRGARKRAPSAAARMRGQALVLTVALLGVLLLGALLLFNTGQTVNAKLRLTNAADAAAYSVAAEQARALNFAAYMNRGRVANEVAVAQMVSMYSWMNNLHTHAGMFQRTFETLSMIPIIGVVFIPLDAVYRGIRYALDSVRRPAVKPGLNAAIRGLDVLDGIYADAATQAIRWATTADNAQLAREVLDRNDPGADFVPASLSHLTLEQLPDARNAFLQTHELGEERTPGMDRYRNVVMESRDEFSRNRHARIEIGPGTSFEIPAYPGTGIEVEITKDVVSDGGTDMVEYGRWSALDTTQLEVGITVTGYVGECLPIVGCARVEKTFLDEHFAPPPPGTMGWGGAHAVESNDGQRFRPGIHDNNGFVSVYEGGRPYRPYNGVDGIPGWVAENDPAAGLPYIGDPSAQDGDEYLEGYTGLRNYDDVRPERARDPDDGPVFTVYARKGDGDVRTSDRIGVGGGAGTSTHLAGEAANNQYTALASAQVYFARPTGIAQFRRIFRGGTRVGEGERGSLFSPYWQARLVDTPAASRAALGIPSP